MTKFLLVSFLMMGVMLLTAGWLLLPGIWPVGWLLVLLLPVGLFLLKRKFPATMNLALVLLCGAAALGLWKGMNLALAFAGMLCVFAAWDLDSFSHRLAFASVEDGPFLIERQHLLRLSLILGLGVVISLASFFIRFSFRFEWVVVLAVLTFLGIGALVNWLRTKED